jgi:21S rRNA (GM2251-2'-O)-methyltransferase
MNTIDDIHGELGNLYLASHLGKGPYKNVRKDELAVRINNAMQKLPPSDGTLDSSQLTTAPDTLKKYFMELRPLMKQLHRVENLKDPHTKPVHHLERLRDPHIETAQSLIANIRAVLHDLNRTIEIAEYSTSAKRQQISLLAYSLLGQTSRRREPRLLATSEKKPQNIQESLLWMCRGHEGEGLELALSKTIAAAVGEGIDGRKVQRHSKTGKESQLALEDEFDSPTSHAVNQTRDQHPRTVEIEEEELRYLRNRADRTSIEDTVGKLRGNTARDDTDIPLSIPRTTAASTFLYGANTVLAALRAHRRKLYKLYLHPRPLENPLQPGTNNRALLIRAAKDLDVDVRKNSSQDLLDAMSDNRPHNGVVLEASQLPAPPVRSLGKVKMDSGVIPLYLEAQNAEDAAVNGSPRIVRLATTARHPFVLMLDGILDPQNMGNIMRTAFFYGVDAVAVSVNTCCPLNSPTLAKASSGACEALEIWALKGPANFVRASKFSGWKVVAAVAPDGNVDVTSHVQVAASSPLRSHPTILMLGAEGTGLRESLKARADYFVSISAGLGSPDGDSEPANLSPSQRERLRMRREVGVDSINVGTAAGVLIDCFLRGALAGNSKHGVVEAEVVREGSPEAALSSRTLSNDEDSETFGDEAHQSEMEADVGSERVRAAVS